MSSAFWVASASTPRHRRRLGRDGADLPRRSAARGRPHRGGRPSLRLRPARSERSRRHASGAAARCAYAARPAGPARPDGRRPFRGGHIRVHRSARPRGVSEAHGAPVVAREPAVGEVRHAAAFAVPGLVDAVAHNRRHGRDDVGLFEIGARFTTRGETRARRRSPGPAPPRRSHWSARGRATSTSSTSKASSSGCATRSRRRRSFRPAGEPYLVAGQAASIVARGRRAARPRRTDHAGRRGRARTAAQDRMFVAELDLDAARAAPSRATTRRSRCRAFRSSSAICRSSSPSALPAEIIRGTIQAAGSDDAGAARRRSRFSIVTRQGRARRPVSLSVRLTFQAPIAR